jgi:malate synthase
LREVNAGHDGTWVAHPGLVPVAKEVFDQYMPAPNQISRKRDEVHVTAKDLLEAPEGDITEAGLRLNIDVGVKYLDAWLHGVGCVPIYNLMEDAATAEISRAQVWQWVKHGSVMHDGRTITAEMVRQITDETAPGLKAAQIFKQMMTSADFEEFLTLPAYENLV